MSNKTTRNRQRRQDALVNYLRQCRVNRQPSPTVGELAATFKVSPPTIARDLEDLERTGQITVRRTGRRIIARTLTVTDWTPQ